MTAAPPCDGEPFGSPPSHPDAVDQSNIADENLRPILDEDGLLRFRGKWTPISDRQLPVVALLTRRFRHLVRTEELVAAYTAVGGTLRDGAVRLLVKRIKDRVAQVDLRLHVVRGRGVVLDAESRPPMIQEATCAPSSG